MSVVVPQGSKAARPLSTDCGFLREQLISGVIFEEAEQILRSGDGEIRPIIDWLHEADTALLLPLLLDAETCSSVLYVLSDLPARRISASVETALKEMLPKLEEGKREWLWADGILRDLGN